MLENIDKYVWYQEGPGVRRNQYTENGVKLLNVANLVDGKLDLSTSKRYISEEEANVKYKHFLVDEGDLIIASSGIKVEYFDKKMGFVKKEDLPLCMNTSTIRFKSKNKDLLNIRYFMYFLKSNLFKKQIRKLITGSAQLNFGPSHLKKIEISICDINEQIKIVNKLDKVQEIIDTKEKQLVELDKYIQNKFLDLFGDPIKNNKNLQTNFLGIICSLKSGKAVNKDSISDKKIEGLYPCYGGNGIRGYINRYSNNGNIPLIGRQGALCGNVQYASGKFYATEHAITVIPNININTCWLYYMLNLMNLNSLAVGVAQPGLTVEKLNKVKIIIANINLQNKFAQIANKVDEQKECVQKSLEEAKELMNSLMNRYFN